MGCDFNFVNKTLNTEYMANEYWLYRNIDRGSKKHLKNVILAVIKLNNWKNTDVIVLSCCCHYYLYTDNNLYDYIDNIANISDKNIIKCDDLCEWVQCNVCNKCL
jgi:hypothetical protein